MSHPVDRSYYSQSPEMVKLRTRINERRAYHLYRRKPGEASRMLDVAGALREKSQQYQQPQRGEDTPMVRAASEGLAHGSTSTSLDIGTAKTRLARTRAALRRGR